MLDRILAGAERQTADKSNMEEARQWGRSNAEASSPLVRG
jgi:hypothetical protein